MRFSMILALVAAAASAAAQTVDMVATRDGQPAGSGRFSLAPGINHSYIQTSLLKLSIDGQQFEFNEVVKIAFDGTTMQTDSKELVGGKVQKNVSITYNTKEATVTDLLTGAKTHYPMPPMAKVKDPGQLWFISIHPAAGSVSTATSFDENTSSWEKTTRTYIKDVPVTVHGLKVMGHELKDEEAGQTIVSIVDDHGLPYEFEVQGIKFTRK